MILTELDFSKLGGMGGPESMEGLGDIDDGAGGDDGVSLNFSQDNFMFLT